MKTSGLGIAGQLTRGFIVSPLTPLFLLAAFAFGIVALLTLPREEEPQISVPMVDIMLGAPGLKADDAVKLVTEPLETIVKSIDGVEHVYSQTSDNKVLVTARFIVGTQTDSAILRVHDKVRANLDRIPVGIPEPMIVGRGIDDVAIVSLTLTPSEEAGNAVSANDLTRVARELRTELSKIDNVGLTYLVGDTDEIIRIAPDPKRLALNGVTLQQLAGKVSGANRAFPAGEVTINGKSAELMVGETLYAPAEIGNLLITTRDGRPVYVRDLADISFATDSTARIVATVTRSEDGAEGAIDRKPAVTLAIAKRAGANAVLVAEQILERTEALEGSLIPHSIAVEVTRDYGETANEKANELLFHLGLATVSIIVLVWLAIGWREALVVAIVIPVTILLDAVCLARDGLHAQPRVAVRADLLDRYPCRRRHRGDREHRPALGHGRRPRAPQAAIEAVAEVGNPTIVATLTVVAALLPMLFVSGMMGPYMSPIPANASAAMVFSFFVAVMVTPWLMLKIAGRAPMHHGHGESEESGGVLGRMYRAVARPVLASKTSSWIFLLVVGVMTLGSLSLFYTKDVTVKLLPFDNKSELSVVIDMPEGTSVEATDAVAQAVAREVLKLEEVKSVQTHAGTAAPFNFNGLVRHSFLRSEPQMGDVALNLTAKSERDRSSHEIALDIRARIAGIPLPEGASLKVVEPPPGPPVMATLLAEIYGPDAETRRAVAARVEEAFRSADFIVDIDNSWGQPAERARVKISTDNLEFFKVQEQDVFDTIGILNTGQTVGYSHRGGGRTPIAIRLERPRSERLVDEAFLTTPIPANVLPGDRSIVELGDVVDVSEERASFPVFRHNGRAAEMVMAELAGTYEAPLYGMIAVQEALDAMDWTGLEKPVIAQRPADRRTGLDAAVGRRMGSHLGDLPRHGCRLRRGPARDLHPRGCPVRLVQGAAGHPHAGAADLHRHLIGHWLFSAPFSATSMIGFIALAGIIVRNSILLVDFIRHAHVPGTPLTPVLIEAGAIRFKPIILTALAAMIGAAVILTDPIFQGLAISLLFGLASSTALTVLVIPAIYRVLRT
jgi:multidrug efflux pump subunit AcrB